MEPSTQLPLYLGAPCDCEAAEDPDGETMCNCTARREASWLEHSHGCGEGS